MDIARIRRAVLATLCSTALLGAVGCSGGDSGAADGTLTLTVATFADLGYEPLYKEYEKSHPKIRIKERLSQFDQHHNQLSTQLASGSGSADVVAVEEGYLPKFRAVKDKFANLAKLGGKGRDKEYLDWKWEQGTTDGGSTVLGYGTDVGGLAICYRTDLFRQAGLPTDRTEVGKLWPTWQDYFDVGERFRSKVPDKAWFDSGGNIFTAMMNQSEFGFFDADDTYIADANPKVKQNFLRTARAAADGQSANLVPFSQQWNAGIKQGRMATMTCPAWMTGQIAEAAGPEAKGKWDIASVPGGGGNWGGSFLTVPEQSAHQQAAADLAAFLTSPASQKKIFQGPTGALPSLGSVLDDPAIAGTKQPYFNGAPTGRIYAASARELQPSFRGTQDQQVRIPFGNALQLVEQRKSSPGEAWDKALETSEKNLKH